MVLVKVAVDYPHTGEIVVRFDANWIEQHYWNFGKMVRVARIKLGMSLRDMANMVGVDSEDLRSIESGIAIPKPEILKRIAHVFELNYNLVDIDNLLEMYSLSQTYYARFSRKYSPPVDEFHRDQVTDKLRELGGIFRAIRKHKDLTLEEMSKQIGVDRSYLSRFESGQRKWSVALLKDLAQALDPSLDLASIFGQIGISEVEYKRLKIKKAALDVSLS